MTRTARVALIVAAALASMGFLALATWQVQRLGWKLDLIARVEHQLKSEPVELPAAQWASLYPLGAEYMPLRLRGQFEPREALVQAATVLGGGYWVLAPLRLEDGGVILVNRGFVPPEQREPGRHVPPAGIVELTGLLRLNEPHGGLLRANDPVAGRWYSRDVTSIAAQLNLAGPVAPFFVDEAADPAQPQRWPRPGLTVLRFANNHAVYAATWLALAAMAAAAVFYLVREERRRAPP